MNPQQQQALEAAMLAKMVGVEMNKVDGLTIDRRSAPANRIDINQFINEVTKNPHQPHQPSQHIQNQANAGYVPEAIVQRMVPDTTTGSSTSLTVGAVVPSNPIIQMQAPPQPPQPVVPNEDLQAIKGHLERISSNLTKLTGMFGKIYCNILDKENINKR
jgi:hypothetical protein